LKQRLSHVEIHHKLTSLPTPKTIISDGV